MAAFRDVREMLLLSLYEGFIDETEFLLLYDVNLSQNPDFPYWTYGPFELNHMNDAECMAEFRSFYIFIHFYTCPVFVRHYVKIS